MKQINRISLKKCFDITIRFDMLLHALKAAIHMVLFNFSWHFSFSSTFFFEISLYVESVLFSNF